jgi:hypothetical protein
MLRILCSTFAAAALVTAAGVAHAAYSNMEAPLSPTTPVATDSVVSIGATTSMNDHDAVVSVPSKGKIVATANADVFCAGEETARSLIIEVEQESDITVDFCESHLERRDVVIRFVAAP